MIELANYESEKATLAAVLADNRLLARVREIVEPTDFADTLHGRIFERILELVDGGETANAITLKPHFAEHPDLKGNGARYLADLSNAVIATLPSIVDDFARHVRDLSLRRTVRQAAEDLAGRIGEVENASDEVVADVVAKLQRLQQSRRQGMTGRQVSERIVHLLEHPQPHFGTGLPNLDDVLGGGLFAGKMYGLAARKKAGKTVLLGTISHNLNAAGVRHLFVAAEMTPVEIQTRNMARDLNVNSLQFLKRQYSRWLIEQAAQHAVSRPDNVTYEGAPGLTLADLKRAITGSVVRSGIKGVVVDYWQLVGGKEARDTEEYHMRQVAQWLADACRKYGLWCLIAAQVNQEGNTRGGEGLRLACDLYLNLHREPGEDAAWLEMQESRYTPYRDVGSKTKAGLWLHHNGPWFEDVAEQAGEAAA